MSDRDHVTCVLIGKAAIRPARWQNRVIPYASIDLIPYDINSRFVPPFTCDGQVLRAQTGHASVLAHTFGRLPLRRPRFDRARRHVFAVGFAFLAFFLAVPSLLFAVQQQDPPLLPDSAVSPLEFARVVGQVELLSEQLAAQYALTEHTLSAITTIITVSTTAIGAVIFLLGFFGYRNLRSDLKKALQSEIDKQLRDTVADRVEGFLNEKELELDKQFTKLFKSMTRLSDPRS